MVSIIDRPRRGLSNIQSPVSSSETPTTSEIESKPSESEIKSKPSESKRLSKEEWNLHQKSFDVII